MPLGKEHVAAAMEILENLARQRCAPITYSVLTRQLGIAPIAAGGVLVPLSRDTFESRRVLLSVLVVSKKTGLPSDRFFDQAKQLGAMKENELPQIFFREELQRVYNAYALSQR